VVERNRFSGMGDIDPAERRGDAERDL